MIYFCVEKSVVTSNLFVMVASAMPKPKGTPSPRIKAPGQSTAVIADDASTPTENEDPAIDDEDGAMKAPRVTISEAQEIYVAPRGKSKPKTARGENTENEWFVACDMI
jgi:hypothetical protein